MPFFSGPAASRCSNACLYKGSRKKSKNWLRRTNIKSNLTLKIEYFTKTKELRCQAVIFALHHTKVQMSTPFLRVRPWNYAHVFNLPLPSLLRMGFFVFVFFSPKMWGPLRPKIYPKNTKKTNIWRKKYKKIVKGPAGAHLTRVQNSGSISQKRRGHWHLKQFGVLCLNQPVSRLSLWRELQRWHRSFCEDHLWRTRKEIAWKGAYVAIVERENWFQKKKNIGEKEKKKRRGRREERE